jgi:hypothetical protein
VVDDLVVKLLRLRLVLVVGQRLVVLMRRR